VSTPLMNMADGLLAVLDERLAPAGTDIPQHYVKVARSLHDAEVALAQLEIDPGPFDLSSRTVRRSEAGYALLEAARAYMGFAVRLRSRVTGQHANKAGEPLRAGLMALAAEAEPAEPQQLMLIAAHALVICSRAAEIAAHPEHARMAGVTLDDPIQHLVSHGVLPILQLAVQLQDGELD
jgi:hypothetical protein